MFVPSNPWVLLRSCHLTPRAPLRGLQRRTAQHIWHPCRIPFVSSKLIFYTCIVYPVDYGIALMPSDHFGTSECWAAFFFRRPDAGGLIRCYHVNNDGLFHGSRRMERCFISPNFQISPGLLLLFYLSLTWFLMTFQSTSVCCMYIFYQSTLVCCMYMFYTFPQVTKIYRTEEATWRPCQGRVIAVGRQPVAWTVSSLSTITVPLFFWDARCILSLS